MYLISALGPHPAVPRLPGTWAPGKAQTLRALSQAAGRVEVVQRCLKAQQAGPGEKWAREGEHPRLTPGCQAAQRRNW